MPRGVAPSSAACEARTASAASIFFPSTRASAAFARQGTGAADPITIRTSFAAPPSSRHETAASASGQSKACFCLIFRYAERRPLGLSTWISTTSSPGLSAFSAKMSTSGRTKKSAAVSVRLPPGASVSIRAFRATRATPAAEGWTIAHVLFPKTAWNSFSPDFARHSTPPFLRHWNSDERKYQQRGRWQRLPASVAALRIWGVAAPSQASARAGKSAFRSDATDASVTRAPIEVPPEEFLRMELWEFSRLRSITWSGARLYSLRRSSSSVPAPFASAETPAFFAAASAEAASSQLLGWTLSKLFTPLPPASAPSRARPGLSLIHISEPTRLGMISYAVFCLKKKKLLFHINCLATSSYKT